MSTTATIAPTGTWTIDATHSRVGFSVKHLGIATVRGEFSEFDGTVEIADDIASSRVYGTVKTASIDTGDPARDEHLRSADFFNAEAYPEITFESTLIDAIDDDVLAVSGDITINGVTKAETFRVEVQGTETDPWGNDRVGLEITGQINRGDYGMKFNQVLGSGNVMVSDKVKIAIDVSAVKAA